MKKSRFTEEQMVKILREADAIPVAEVAKKHKLSEQTLYTWRKRFGTLQASEVKRLKQLVLIPAIAESLSAGDTASPEYSSLFVILALTLGKVVAFIAFMLIVGRRVIPNILHFVSQARAANPTLKIIARAHSDGEVEHLQKCGATATVMGEHEVARGMLLLAHA